MATGRTMPGVEKNLSARPSEDVRNRDDDDLKLHVDCPCGRCDVSFDHIVDLVHVALLLSLLGALISTPPIILPGAHLTQHDKQRPYRCD